MIINIGILEDPIYYREYRDIKIIKYDISYLFTLGDFLGGREGGVLLWELKTIVKLRPGDLFFLYNNLITHSNEPVQGVRYSIIVYIYQDIFDWKKREGEFYDDRDESDKEMDKEREKI
jgi:hypothetical protein